MGSRCSIVIEAQSEPEAAHAAAAAFDEIARIEQVLSDYRADSESMLLTGQDPGNWHPISPILMDVLVRSRDIHNRTRGVFDPTVGAYTHLWRLPGHPSRESLRDASDRVGFGLLQLDERGSRVRFDQTGIILDFGGIGKGYAAQRAMGILRARGLTIASIDMGGDLVLGDPPSEQPEGWRVQIITGITQTRTEFLSNCAVATSGDLERFYEYNGVRYSHIVDPRTGLGITQRRAASVIAPDGALADALASAVSVLGQEHLDDLQEQFPGVRITLVSRSMENE